MSDTKLSEAASFGMWLTTRPAMTVGGDHTVYSMIDAIKEWEERAFVSSAQWTDSELANMKRRELDKQKMSETSSRLAGEASGMKIAPDGPQVTMGQERLKPVPLGVFDFHGLQAAVDARSYHIDPDGRLGPLFFATELGGEIGEALNVVKKIERDRMGIAGSRDDPSHLAKELADGIITCCNLARYYGIDLHLAIVQVFNQTSRERNLPVLLK